jgi:methionyl-tRNA formyltransferase
MRVIVNKAQVRPFCPCGPNRPPVGTIEGVGIPPELNIAVIGAWPGNTNLVFISELQPAGKKRMTAEEFLRGHPVVEGNARFGPEVLS